jgi:hypothetical protein
LASIGSKRRRSELFTVGPKLLELGDDIVDVRILRRAWENHLGAGNLGARVFQIFLQCRHVSSDARILVDIAVGVVRVSACLAAHDAV